MTALQLDTGSHMQPGLWHRVMLRKWKAGACVLKIPPSVALVLETKVTAPLDAREAWSAILEQAEQMSQRHHKDLEPWKNIVMWLAKGDE